MEEETALHGVCAPPPQDPMRIAASPPAGLPVDALPPGHPITIRFDLAGAPAPNCLFVRAREASSPDEAVGVRFLLDEGYVPLCADPPLLVVGPAGSEALAGIPAKDGRILRHR